MKPLRNFIISAIVVLAVLSFLISPGSIAYAAAGGGDRGGMGMVGGRGRSTTPVDNTPRTLAPYFTPAKSTPKATDPNGFIQRWMLLDPISNNLRTNTGFNEAYIRNTFNSESFKKLYEVTPKDGDKVTINNEELTWHALDSNLWNVKLFRFAYGLNKTIYGITFFAYTVVDCPNEIKDVRMVVGSNSASMWWLNGKEVVGLFGDRRMVMDDCASKRLTLNKGKNVIRGVVINGPGMSDFCVRFIDENDKPVKNLTITLE